MRVELFEEGAAVGVTHRLRDPAQVVVVDRQHVRLLVVQVLDAVLHAAQELVGRGQRVGRVLRHEVGARQPLQRIERGARAQLGELAAAHHLQQLHGEFDFADAAARELHVVGALGASGAAARRLLADLAVQDAQRIEHAVVEVAAEHEGQHHVAQRLGLAAEHHGARRDHAALHPGKALPFAALHLEILFQRVERDHARPRVAVGPQRQVDAEHEAVLGHVAHQRIDALHGPREVLLVGQLAAPVGIAGRVAVDVVQVDEVDVAGHIELARAELAHADHPQLRALAFGAERRAVLGVEFMAGVLAGDVQRQFGQLGHGRGHHGERGLLVAIECDQTFHDELAHDAQGIADGHAARAQGVVGDGHRFAPGLAGRQQFELGRIAAAQPLDESGTGRKRGRRRIGWQLIHTGVGWRGTRLKAGGHNSRHSAILNERHGVFPFTSAPNHRCDSALAIGSALRCVASAGAVSRCPARVDCAANRRFSRCTRGAG
ncbi:hypothetical protein D9M68_582470 [compost metagenome]